MKKLKDLTFDEYIKLIVDGMLWEKYPEATGETIKDINDTSIKKYIPENYELNLSKEPYVDIDIDDSGLLTFYLKKKKYTFEDYFYDYTRKNKPLSLDKFTHEDLFGLLKLICDDFNVTVKGLIYYLVTQNSDDDKLNEILSMLPEGFLEKIFV